MIIYFFPFFRQLPISPCALMMGILYSERLRQLNPSYLERVSSSDIYVVSMVSFAISFNVLKAKCFAFLAEVWLHIS